MGKFARHSGSGREPPVRNDLIISNKSFTNI